MNTGTLVGTFRGAVIRSDYRNFGDVGPDGRGLARFVKRLDGIYKKPNNKRGWWGNGASRG